MDRRLTENTTPLINLVTAVDQVSDITRVSLTCCLVQTLQNIAAELVLADVEWSLCEGRARRLCAALDHQPRGLKITEVRGHVKGALVVDVLLVQHFLEQQGCLSAEILRGSSVVLGSHQTSEISEDGVTPPGVEGLISCFKALQLTVKSGEISVPGYGVKINIQ